MDSYQSMTEKLYPLRLYDIEGGEEINTELRVLADEVDLLFAALDIMTREYFIATAQSWGLSNRESFAGAEKPGLTVEERRNLLLLSEHVTGFDCTPSGFEEFVRSCGVSDFEFTEAFSHYKVALYVHDELDSGMKNTLKTRVNAYYQANCQAVIRYNTEE